MTQSYLQKIFNGYVFDNYFILQLGYFLGVSVKEMVNVSNDNFRVTGIQNIYRELSERYDLAYSIVTEIGNEILKFTNQLYVSQRTGSRATQYDKLDNECLPQVKSVVQQILFSNDRPTKLSFAKVQKALRLPQKQLNKLPKCKAYIEKYLESQEEFWAREVEWAVTVLMQENRQINRSCIMRMTNMRPNDIKCCCPHIKNKEIQALVQLLLNE